MNRKIKYGIIRTIAGMVICFMFFYVLSCKKSGTITSPIVSKTFYSWNKFVMGADLSYVNQVQDYNGVYKDSNTVKDPFVIFANHGANTVRVRLWHNPQWMLPYTNNHLYSDINDVEKTIQRAKAQGMATCLDLHYSDTWTDPSNQAVPAAWSGLSLATLKDSLYKYTLNVLNELNSKNLVPEFIQLGNEINNGMLFPVGKVTNNDWAQLGELLNSAIYAVRFFSLTASVKPKIILHVAGLENADWWAGNIITNGKVNDFDILGISWYYFWSSVTVMTDISGNIASLKSKYNKAVMIVETACPWTKEFADSYNNVVSGDVAMTGYEVSKDGQYKLMKDLTQQVINGGGTGVIYWEPAWITSGLKTPWGTGSAWENNAFFDFSGNALPAMDFMNFAYHF